MCRGIPPLEHDGCATISANAGAERCADTHGTALQRDAAEKSATTSDARAANALQPDAITPLNWWAMGVVFMIQISEALNATVLFPFVVFMLRDFGVSERRVGFWSGVLGASFFAAQVVSSYSWGRAADFYGCKRCLVLGSVGTTLSSVAFALSRSVAWALGARLLCGLLNGNIGVMKSYLTQMTDESNRPTAFAVMPLGFGLGIVSASSLGGALARPADSWPRAFSARFWRAFPYALPLLVCAAFQLLTVVAAQLLIEDDSAAPATKKYASVDADEDVDEEPEAARVPVWRRRGPVLACLSYASMAGGQILFDELFPLYARGCAGWTAETIGTFLSATGTSVFVGAAVAPRFIRRTSLRFTFFAMNFLNVPLGMTIPVLPRTWPMLFTAYFGARVIQTTAFTAVMIIVNSSAPTGDIGAVNGMGQSMAAFMRALGPLLGGSLWSSALAARRDAESDATEQKCPGAFTLLPYGARAAMVSVALCTGAGLYAARGTDDEPAARSPSDGGDVDEAAAFSPSLGEPEVEMV